MGGPPCLDDFPTLANPLADRVAALAANIGRQTADVAFTLFAQPMAPELRQRFEAETLTAISDMLDEFGQFATEDRRIFQKVAVLALERRLAHLVAIPGAGSAA